MPAHYCHTHPEAASASTLSWATLPMRCTAGTVVISAQGIGDSTTTARTGQATRNLPSAFKFGSLRLRDGSSVTITIPTVRGMSLARRIEHVVEQLAKAGNPSLRTHHKMSTVVMGAIHYVSSRRELWRRWEYDIRTDLIRMLGGARELEVHTVERRLSGSVSNCGSEACDSRSASIEVCAGGGRWWRGCVSAARLLFFSERAASPICR